MLKHRLLRTPWVIIMILSVVVILIVFGFNWLNGARNLKTPDELGIQLQTKQGRAVLSGTAWKPGEVDVEGFAAALENEGFLLKLNESSTQIIVVDKQFGTQWRSNPPTEQLKQEKVKGILLSNLKSPFILEYFQTSGSDTARREIANVTNRRMQTEIETYSEGIQVHYFLEGKDIGFVIQYELTEHGLSVYLPSEGIQEAGNHAVYSIDLLPYFGFGEQGEAGYLFVPDGPGGIIRFDEKRPNSPSGYSEQIYGREISNKRNDLEGSVNNSTLEAEPIAFPVYGVKKGDSAFAAIISSGESAASIIAMPPGIKSTYYNINANFMYREEYLRKQSQYGSPIKSVEKSRVKEDRSIEFRFMNGEDADYIGMAHAYQEYLVKNGLLKEKLPSTANVPLELRLMGGSEEVAFNQKRYVDATTFDQAGEIIRYFKENGVESAKIIYEGWQATSGGLSKGSIRNSLGGESGAKAFVETAHQAGYQVLFKDNVVWANGNESGISPKSDGIRGIDRIVYQGTNSKILLKPALSIGYAEQAISVLEKIGVDGIHYSTVGDLVFNDYEPNNRMERSETSSMYESLLNYSQKRMGLAGISYGNAYALSGTDYITELPEGPSYHFVVDETVPFYPAVLHGYLTYSFTAGNLRDEDRKEWLRAIEYGAIPAFYLTYEPSRVLKETSVNYLFSSEFRIWKERVTEEYEQFNRLAPLIDQRIIGHERLGDGKFATHYENGISLIVDYQQQSFELQEGGEHQ